MKIPLSWLYEYITPELNPEQIAKTLTLLGLEVDDIETITPGFERVVVGKVLKVEKHPNADKLCVAQVTDGIETYQVVCGAPNCKEGMKTALALIGAVLRDEKDNTFTVKKTQLRGVDSYGMLCAAKELQIGTESDGIMELDNHLKEGADLALLYADSIFEISLTPNLGHCASLIGIARELSAATGHPVQYPKVTVKEETANPVEKAVQVQVQDKKGCPRYACRFVKDVVLGPSPAWMQQRLIASGLNPINNVVDITNYVVLEMGQPLHAFDYDTLKGHTIIVREAKPGEKIVTLDDKERTLSAGDVLICDAEKPVAIAGVMGGVNSEVSDRTTNVLLEAAYFNSTSIRKTSKRLGLSTDASKRFERGCDPNILEKALDRAAMLLQELAGGHIAKGIVDVAVGPFLEKQVTCRLSRVNSILGTQLSLSEVESVFHRLGMHYRSDGQELLTVTVPTYRADISHEIDLIEEVARIYGYTNIGKASATYQSSTLAHAPIFLFEREIRARMISESLQEFITCDLIGPTLSSIVKEKQMGEDAIVRVMNPTSIEQSILRTSLMPGLLQVVKYNIDHQNHDISGFEVGRIHFKEGELYNEQSVVGVVLTGKNAPHDWMKKSENVDFYELKGIIENLLKGLNISNYSFKNQAYPSFHSGRQASVYVGACEIGTLGEVHPAILRRLDVSQRILFAEFNLQDLMSVRKKGQLMKELPLYPCSERDWTVTLKKEIAIQDVFDIIHAIPSKLLEMVSLIDIYRSEKLGPDQQNVTLRFVYRDLEKTIDQESVEAEHKRIIEEVIRVLKQG